MVYMDIYEDDMWDVKNCCPLQLGFDKNIVAEKIR